VYPALSGIVTGIVGWQSGLARPALARPVFGSQRCGTGWSAPHKSWSADLRADPHSFFYN